MRKMSKMLLILTVFAFAMSFSSCSKVPAGNVGVKFYMLGGDKGVDSEELAPGRYWIGINEELYLFPTFTQNYVWTADKREGSRNNEEISFQSNGGLGITADVGVTYHLDPLKVSDIFQKYKRGIEEITDVFLRNQVRDAFVNQSSTREVESLYGTGKADFLNSIEAQVKAEVGPIGIIVDKIYLVGAMRLPDQVVIALNNKIEAKQTAERKENELQQAEADAKKVIAVAEGKAGSILKEATAQAKANRILAASLTPTLVKYKAIETWNGVLPTYTGGPIPLINIK